MCYDRCRSGYDGVGPVCWERCPPGWNPSVDLLYPACSKPSKEWYLPGLSFFRSSYGRGVGENRRCRHGDYERPYHDSHDSEECADNKCNGGFLESEKCWHRCPYGMKQCGAFCYPEDGGDFKCPAETANLNINEFCISVGGCKGDPIETTSTGLGIPKLAHPKCPAY